MRRPLENGLMTTDADQPPAAEEVAPLVYDELRRIAAALSLLEHHSRAGRFLERPIADAAPELPADVEPLALGTVVGAYTIEREIGRGGMGHVYLASDARLGRAVAPKALAQHLRTADHAVAPARHAAWWRTHQIVITAFYTATAILAWQMKEWAETPVTVAVFLALGAAATIGGVLRGHLVFTERMNRARLPIERRRTTRALFALDFVMTALVAGDAAWIAPVRVLPAVFALSAAAGLALASFVLEPATRPRHLARMRDRD